MTKPPLGMRASRNCHQVHPKKVSKNCQEACFFCLKRQKVFEVWGQSQLAESYSLASPDFLQPFSRWFLGGGFKDFECFFTTSNWRNKSKKMKCASSFLFTSSAERNHQTSLFAHILRGFGCSMCFFSQWVKRCFVDRSRYQCLCEFRDMFALDPQAGREIKIFRRNKFNRDVFKFESFFLA